MKILTHNLGFPRIGLRRELRKALESYLAGRSTPADLLEASRQIRQQIWLLPKKAGACFGRLMGADGISCLPIFVAGGFAMVARQLLAHWHFNPLANFAVAAFVATSIASLSARYSIGGHPDLVIASSVLLLIPGFPLINAVSDMVKGYVNTGVVRWAFATLSAPPRNHSRRDDCFPLTSSVAIARSRSSNGQWRQPLPQQYPRFR